MKSALQPAAYIMFATALNPAPSMPLQANNSPAAVRRVDIKLDEVLNRLSAVSQKQDTIAEKFDKFSKKWKSEIKYISSPSRILGNENYYEIIKLGDAAIPLIIKDLQNAPYPWFHALRILVEDEADKHIGEQYAGDDKKMAACWIDWGKFKKIIN